jgi:hypothetical protein
MYEDDKLLLSLKKDCVNLTKIFNYKDNSS